MKSDLNLRRKWTLRAHGEQVVFVKKINERAEHVLMKAFIWALYLPDYPDLAVEIAIGDRYRPDVVSMDTHQRPRFWGEAGRVSKAKVESLMRRYRTTHFAIAKWAAHLDPWVDIVQEAVAGLERTAPVDLLNIPADSAHRFIDDRGVIHLGHEDLAWIRIA